MVGRQIGAGYRSTLLARDENNLIMSPEGRNGLNKSASLNSIQRDERFQRSQLNIDKKMREDFDRLQN